MGLGRTAAETSPYEVGSPLGTRGAASGEYLRTDRDLEWNHHCESNGWPTSAAQATVAAVVIWQAREKIKSRLKRLPVHELIYVQLVILLGESN